GAPRDRGENGINKIRVVGRARNRVRRPVERIDKIAADCVGERKISGPGSRSQRKQSAYDECDLEFVCPGLVYFHTMRSFHLNLRKRHEEVSRKLGDFFSRQLNW